MATFSGPGSLAELASRDPIGDRIHLILACGTLASVPLNGTLASGFMIALVIWGLVRTAFWREYLPTGPRVIMIPALVWVGYLILSLAWSPDLRTGWHQVWAQTWLALPALIWPLMNRWRLLLAAVVVGTVSQALFHTGMILIDGYRIDGWGFAGFDSHPRRVAVWYAAVTVGLVLADLAGITSRRWWLLCIAPLLTATLLSESRGATLAIGVALAVCVPLLACRRYLNRRSVITIIASLILVSGAVAVSKGETVRQVQESATKALDALVDGKVEDIRIAWWRSCLRQWETRPILGFGIGGTREALAGDLQLREETRNSPQMSQYAVFNQPHSVYLQTLLEGGILGMTLLVWVLGSVAIVAYRNLRQDPIAVLALGGLVVWMVTALFDQWHAQGQVLALLWMSATIAAFDPNWLDADSDSGNPEPAE